MPFRDLIGHRRLVSLLARAVQRDSAPPSLLITGPDGVGKRRLVLALAQTLNCPTPLVREAPPADRTTIVYDACGTCASCRRIARRTHGDVIWIEPGETGSIKIEPIREAVEAAAYRPFEARRRVIAIDPADALLPAAQNALLKTLEEPPSGSVFALITSRPDVLLPTVRSRCPRLRLARLDAADIALALTRDHGFNDASAHAAAAVADGSLGRALALSSEDGASARDGALDLLMGLTRLRDPQRRLAHADQTLIRSAPKRGERAHVAARLRATASLIRDIQLLASGADARALANADLANDLRGLVESWTVERASHAFEAIDRALEALNGQASFKIVSDWMAMEI